MLPAAAFALTVVMLVVVSALAGEAESTAPVTKAVGDKVIPWANDEKTLTMLWIFAPLGAVAGIVGAWICYSLMMKADEGDEAMKKIAGHVRKGARAYLKRQYKVVALVFLVLFLFFCFLSYVLNVLPGLVPFAFLTGGFFSGLCGWIGMNSATRASNRTAAGAKQSLNRGLRVAFQSGAVMGLIVVGLGLLDICLWFAALYWLVPAINPAWELSLTKITVTMLCFGMGASLQALFARVGGGIFTKAADVGADLVGKVEAGIPEDDPRNPATIADNVGDNVGDVAGMGADLYESYCGSVLATAALGVAAYHGAKDLTAEQQHVQQLGAAFLPMIIAGVGVLLSALCVGLVRTKEGATQSELLKALNRAVYASAVGILVLSLLACGLVLGWGRVGLGVWGAVVAGLLTGVVIGQATEYFTSGDRRPTQSVAQSSQTGPATLIIEGIACGMQSTWIPVVAVCVGTIAAYILAGGGDPALGLYGVGLAAVGMLSTLGLTLATDAYGPIADNAGGNAEMSHQPPEVRERTDALDSLGNTTAATGKGFAIGSAALTALALLAAYIEELRNGLNQLLTDVAKADVQGAMPGGLKLLGEKVRAFIDTSGEPVVRVMIDNQWIATADMSLKNFMEHYDVTLMNPHVLVGMFLGAMTAFLFCSMTMKAVGRAAQAMVEEVRRQFRTIAGLMEGKAEADYATCVDIATKGAQKEMMLPSLLAVIIPIAAGLVLGAAGVLGLLAGGLVTGFALAVFMANAGGAWDNAKKFIETGKLGGKGSDNHKAAVVGDTVGDPFKDTSGPSLNILIKLMSLVSVVAAGLVVKYGGLIEWVGDLLKKS
jgi:K(+)-stimulated pyrophosphate-energized sodium pump